MYRKELRPVLTSGARAVEDLIGPKSESWAVRSLRDQDPSKQLALTRPFDVELRGFEPLTSSMPWHSPTLKSRDLALYHGH